MLSVDIWVQSAYIILCPLRLTQWIHITQFGKFVVVMMVQFILSYESVIYMLRLCFQWTTMMSKQPRWKKVFLFPYPSC